jgi:hypothetical protein
MTTAMREVSLPADLCQAVEQRFGEQFTNLEECLVFVLGELVRDDARKLDQRDQQMIEDRLRALGYI